MKIWCFKAEAGDLWALTNEPAGANLPIELGPWKLHRESELSGASEDEREAMSLIAVHGFCCFRSEAAA